MSASFPSRLTFWWFNWLMQFGYKNTLTETNIPDLRPQDKSQHVVAQFVPRWMSALQKARTEQMAKSWTSHRGVHRAWSTNSNTDLPDERTPLLSATSPATNNSTGAANLNGSLMHGQKKSESNRNRIKLTSPSLAWTLLRTFWFNIFLVHILKLPCDLLTISNPFLLGQLVDFVEQQNNAVWKGYVLAVSLFVSRSMQMLLYERVLYTSLTLGLRMRSALVSAIFKKALTIDNISKSESTVGQVVNLMSVDTEHIELVMSFVWLLWSSMLQICLTLYLLYTTVGVSMFAGAGFLIILIPANGVATRILGTYQRQLMQFKDQRMKVFNEMLSGIKIVKLFAWEKSFERRILNIRELELKKLLHSGYVDVLINFTWAVAPFMTSMVTYLAYVYVSDNHYLDPKTAFVAISLFDVLRAAIIDLPYFTTDLIQAAVSVRRIGKFLCHNDLDTKNVNRDPSDSTHAITMRNGTFRWQTEEKPVLHKVYLSVEDASLTAVVGPVGCGKSSLLSSMLGEMDKLSGMVNVRGSVAYVPQQAWIQNTTLRNNILFGCPMDMALYNACLDGCALRPDLDILPAGDLTEIGERGINLSGGQKQRISLARALYAQADIYLLDDPLSAVDSHVGRHIFDRIIGHGGLLDGKVRVLVTHGLQYLPLTDQVLVMEDGRITESGQYEKLLAHNGPFARLITNYLIQDDPSKDNENKTLQTLKQEMLRKISETEEDEGKVLPVDCSSSGIFPQLSRSVSRTSDHSQDLKQERKDKLQQQNSIAKIIEEEKVEIGTVNFRIFKHYLRAVGYFYGLFLVLALVCSGAMATGGHIFLSSWTDDANLANFTLWPANSTERREANDYYIGIYGLFAALQSVCIIVFSVFESKRAVEASRTIHASMLHSIVQAPMSFFDTTPAGRLINRFSKDVEDMDQSLPQMFYIWADDLTGMIFALIVISYSTPLFLVFVLPMAVIYLYIQRYTVTTSRQLQRLISKTRSPIFNHFSETLTGASVIRAFGEQQRFELESEAKVDLNSTFKFYNYCANRWSGLRLELLGSLIVLLAAGIAVATRDHISGSIVGLSITYALSLTETLSAFVRHSSTLELKAVSVERILEYIEVEREAEWEDPVVKSPQSWPKQGSIKVEKLCLRYREGLDLVLKQLNFEIKPGEKVGIVGRTGAGKSSLTLALFRLVEAASGKIFIDGVDISELGLHDLRPKITILPQDPVVFAGTLRDNLDPFSEFDDDAVWRSLEHAHLKKFVDGLSLGLGHMCTEGGENLSVGQRQLVCLARALLHKTKILVLDEATAAVDMETDELIQETIRTEFKDCTILTIAHRLNTVMDYDRILVLDHGEVREFDSPAALLANPEGLFHDMAKAASIAF